MSFDWFHNVRDATFWAKDEFPVITTGAPIPALQNVGNSSNHTVTIVVGANPCDVPPTELAKTYLVMESDPYQEVVWVNNVNDLGNSTYSFDLSRAPWWSPFPRSNPETAAWLAATAWPTGTVMKPYLTSQHMQEIVDSLQFGGPITTMQYIASMANQDFGGVSSVSGFTLFKVACNSGSSGTPKVSLIIKIPDAVTAGKAVVAVSSIAGDSSALPVAATVYMEGSMGQHLAQAEFLVSAGGCRVFEIVYTGATVVAGDPHFVSSELGVVPTSGNTPVGWGAPFSTLEVSELNTVPVVDFLPGYHRLVITPTEAMASECQLTLHLDDSGGATTAPADFHVMVNNSTQFGSCSLACSYTFTLPDGAGSLASNSPEILLGANETAILHVLYAGASSSEQQVFARWETLGAEGLNASTGAGVSYPFVWVPVVGNNREAKTPDEAVNLMMVALFGASNNTQSGFQVCDGSLDGTASNQVASMVEALQNLSSAVSTLAARVHALENP